MQLEYDKAKRDDTLKERGLDFADFPELMAGTHLVKLDDRQDYSEDRWVAVGTIRGRLMVVAFTMRGDVYRVFSMRKANKREQKSFKILHQPKR